MLGHSEIPIDFYPTGLNNVVKILTSIKKMFSFMEAKMTDIIEDE